MKIQRLYLNVKDSNLAAWREQGRLEIVPNKPDLDLLTAADAAIPLQAPDSIPGLPFCVPKPCSAFVCA